MSGFDGLQYAKIVGERVAGRLGPFYHVNDVSVYLGRQREERVLDQKHSFYTCVLHFEPRVVRFSLCEHSKLLC